MNDLPVCPTCKGTLDDPDWPVGLTDLFVDKFDSSKYWKCPHCGQELHCSKIEIYAVKAIESHRGE